MKLSLGILLIFIFASFFLYLHFRDQKNREGLNSISIKPKRRNVSGREDSPKTFGLILRENVPEKVKMALNAMNAPAVKGIKNLPPIPKSFDCREEWPGLITGPLNQEDCGSCWAFAIATSSSDRLRISDPNHPELTRKIQYRDDDELIEELENFDPWHLASCNLCEASPIGKLLKDNKICKEDACQGQVLQVGMQYVRQHGLILMSCDPHTQECIKDNSCIYDCETNKCKTFKPLFFHQFDDSLAEQLGTERGKFNQYAVMNDGPIVIGIAVYQSFMDFYKKPENAKKVYSNKVKSAVKNDKKIGGHAVVIIGWGTDDEGTDYWLIRNSWGRKWADGGFFRLERGNNFIGCGDDVWASHWGDKCKTCIDVLLGPSATEGK